MRSAVWCKGLQKGDGDNNFAKITNDSRREIFVSLLVRDGMNFVFIIVEFSVSSLIKVDNFSLFHRGAFPEKEVFIFKLSSSTFLGSRVICIYITPNKLLYLIFFVST